MSRVAAEVGVSRQVLYKEIGTRQALAEALVARETDMFLSGVVDCLAMHPDDPLAGISRAAEFTLRSATHNPLLRAVPTEPDSGPRPLLAVEPALILDRAVEALALSLRARYPRLDLDDAGLADLTEVIVRLTLSYVLQPTRSIDRAIGQLRAVTAGLLDLSRPAPSSS